MQFTQLVALASFVLAVQADASSLESAIKKIVTDAGKTDDAVSSFEGSQGITAALGVQTNAGTLSDDLDAAVSAASGVSTSDSAAIAKAYATLTDPVTTLLKDLASKSKDFATVGTTSVVQQDLTQLQGKTNSLAAAIYKFIDCDAAATIASVNSVVGAAYESANKVYSNDNVAGPDSTCQGGAATSAAGSSSAAATSAAATSAAESSAAGSSAAAETSAAETSAAESSAAGSAAATSASESSAAAPAEGSAASTQSAVAVGAADRMLVGAGAGAAAFAAVALLL